MEFCKKSRLFTINFTLRHCSGFISESTETNNNEDNMVKTKTDHIQKTIGEMGKWQIFVCAVIFLLKFPVAWHQMSIIFLGKSNGIQLTNGQLSKHFDTLTAPAADFKCANESISDKCSKDCHEHEFNTTIFTKTIVTEWDLVCEDSHLANLSQTIFMLGILVGNMFFGALADKFGRRIPLVIAVTVQLIFGVSSAYAPYFWMFVVFRFVTAMATGGTMVTSFVLVMEIIGIKWRELVSVLYQIPFNLGHLTLPLFAYYLRDWHSLQFALSIPSILLLSYFWLVPESPRWLFTVGRMDESVAILEKAAKRNGLPHENIKSNLAEVNSLRSANDSRGNILDLFRTKNMRVKTICMTFNWFVCGMGFFGVAQYIGEAGGNIFKNVAMSAVLELPGTVVCVFLLKYWGRKKTLMASNMLTGVAMLTIAIVPPENTDLIVVLASIGIVGMCISFPTVYLYGGELFPTVIRNIGIGTASMIARIGSMIAPFVASGLAQKAHWLPPVIFGIVPIIGSVLVIFLPGGLINRIFIIEIII